MAKSKHFQEIIQLGKAISESFLKDGHTNTTVSWVGQYLAQLIFEVESEQVPAKKRKLQRECIDLIMDLWQSRQHFPADYRPLAGLSDAVSVLKALKDPEAEDRLHWQRFDDFSGDIPWGSFANKLRRSFHKMIVISLCATATSDILNDEKKWLKHADLLSEDERQVLKLLDSLLREDPVLKIIFSMQGDSKGKGKGDGKGKKEPVLEESKMTRVLDKLETTLGEVSLSLAKLREDLNQEGTATKKSRRR